MTKKKVGFEISFQTVLSMSSKPLSLKVSGSFYLHNNIDSENRSPNFESFSDITNSEKSKENTYAPERNCLETTNELFSVLPSLFLATSPMASGPFPHADALPCPAPLATRAKYQLSFRNFDSVIRTRRTTCAWVWMGVCRGPRGQL